MIELNELFLKEGLKGGYQSLGRHVGKLDLILEEVNTHLTNTFKRLDSLNSVDDLLDLVITLKKSNDRLVEQTDGLADMVHRYLIFLNNNDVLDINVLKENLLTFYNSNMIIQSEVENMAEMLDDFNLIQSKRNDSSFDLNTVLDLIVIVRELMQKALVLHNQLDKWVIYHNE